MARRFENRHGVPDPAAGAASGRPNASKNFVRAYRMFPVAGALIGGAIALLCLVLRLANVPDLAAAALALGAGALLTGALGTRTGWPHVADGFGGEAAAMRRQKLEIMRDSRLGTYGGESWCCWCSALSQRFPRWSAIPDAVIVVPRA